MKLANRMNQLGTETAFEVLAKAKKLEAEGKNIIHLEIGQPDFPTPDNICDAAIKAIENGEHGYTPSAGIGELRDSIARYISGTRGIDVSPDEVVFTPGAKPIMFYTMLALIDEGDEVIYPNPGFPIYESMIKYVGGTAVPLRLREEMNFSFNVEDLTKLITKKTKLIVLNTPQNPTGGIVPKETILKVAEAIKDKDIMVLSDEIYSRLIFSGEHFSIASIPGFKDRTIILDGFSKTYAMTGWRAGYGIMNKDLADQFSKLMTNSNSCVNLPTQRACIEAYEGPQDAVEVMKAEFIARRDIIVEGLNSIKGFKCNTPDGAFYAFPNITGTGYSSRELTDHLLYNANVAALSGTAFGEFGEGYLRFSYANSRENIREAIKRIKEVL